MFDRYWSTAVHVCSSLYSCYNASGSLTRRYRDTSLIRQARTRGGGKTTSSRKTLNPLCVRVRLGSWPLANDAQELCDVVACVAYEYMCLSQNFKRSWFFGPLSGSLSVWNCHIVGRYRAEYKSSGRTFGPPLLQWFPCLVYIGFALLKSRSTFPKAPCTFIVDT